MTSKRPSESMSTSVEDITTSKGWGTVSVVETGETASSGRGAGTPVVVSCDVVVATAFVDEPGEAPCSGRGSGTAVVVSRNVVVATSFLTLSLPAVKPIQSETAMTPKAIRIRHDTRTMCPPAVNFSICSTIAFLCPRASQCFVGRVKTCSKYFSYRVARLLASRANAISKRA